MFAKLENKINIVEKFNIFALIAAVLIIVGLVSVILLPFNVNFFNLDIDFAGGTTMHYNMHKQLEKAELDAIAKDVETVIGAPVSSIQKAGDGTEVIIKTNILTSEQRDAVFSALKEKYSLHDGTEKVEEGQEPAHSDILSVDNVDSVMGADLRNSAIFSALLAVLLMLVYIAIRFDVRSGLAAVTALIHDLLVVMGIYVVFRIPLNMNFIAVVLTILGYSINATIVIFDRIRENKKIMRKTSFNNIVNKSIWQTATRSVNTTITTLLAIIVILFLGVTSVRNFMIPLAGGIVAGLYSSMFISGPIWAKLTKSANKA